MIGDIVILRDTYYIECNRTGTMRKISTFSKIPFWKKFWLEFRDKFKKWDHIEAIEFVIGD